MTDDERLLSWTVADFSGADFHGALAALAANILRVARGSGNEAEILQQIITCSSTLRRYAEEHDEPPSPIDIRRTLSAGVDHASGKPSNSAVEATVSGALQIAASRISRNRSLEDRGKLQLISAVREARWPEKGEDF